MAAFLYARRGMPPWWLPAGAAWEACCAEGRELLEPYLKVCGTLLEDGPIARVRRKMGLGRSDHEERVEALMEIPGDAYQRLVLEADDARREAQIRAVIAGRRSRRRERVEVWHGDGCGHFAEGEKSKICATCGQPFVPATHEHIYCCWECVDQYCIRNNGRTWEPRSRERAAVYVGKVKANVSNEDTAACVGCGMVIDRRIGRFHSRDCRIQWEKAHSNGAS